jgi:putative FmdB family regulatory protein
MPIYEYKCQKCGNELEVMQKVSDPAPVKCEKCGAENSHERLMSRTSFQLKGGGWYSDLYSSAKKDSGGGGGSGGSSSGSSGSSSGS